MRFLRCACAISIIAVGAVVPACGSDSSSTFWKDTDAGPTSSPSATPDASLGGGAGPADAARELCDETCPSGLVCDRGVCLPPQAKCVAAADCEYDTYCDSQGQCVPYGSKPDNRDHDPTCKLSIPVGALSPKTHCEFAKPPAGDPFPNHVDVQATPAVVNFNGSAGAPSIVAPFTAPVDGGYTENLGIVRILRGTNCTLEANLGGVDLDGDTKIDWVRSSSPVAVGDLDGDGVAEIVVYMADESTVAFTRKAGAWKPLWPKVRATLADGTTPFISTVSGAWAGPSLHDLDDDGRPEIIREGYVIDGRTGKLRSGLPPSYASYSQGLAAVLAPMKQDGTVQLTNGAYLWTFERLSSTWSVDTAYAKQTSPAGWTGIADFDPYDGKKRPEIAVATGGRLTVYTLEHTLFMGMDVAVPGGGGGPPTIADYDGDGLPEIGLAGADYYTVFDPDCQPTPRPGGKCADRTHCDGSPGGACPNLVLWSRKTQDHSSNVTGSSVFDFEADGKAEVVYADECFARVYSGLDGRVLFSQYHSSCTWLENPVVADVDGDYRAELVVPSNTACGPAGIGTACAGSLDANGVDPQYAGLICQTNADCFSNVCDQGLCRCTAGAQCCAANSDAACLEAGYKCVPPPAGTAGAGNTCRAARPHGVQGIRVFKDARDRWVRSRSIWNQHAYAVTHVGEDGTLPKTSAWASNWATTSLNNFRQNVPGTADGKAIGDLTAQAGPFFTCSGGAATLSVPICNRGTAPVGAGIAVGFYVGPSRVCGATTPATVPIGQCVTVSCTWSSPPSDAASAADVSVVANDGNLTQECNTQNDRGLVHAVYCARPR